MISDRKLAANRRNAQRSTGPRTPAGRARSSQNALRHGLHARSAVIPRAEDPAAWDAHLASTLASLAPVGPLEVTLAERAALLLWRLGRVARYEHETIATAHRRAPDEVVAEDEEDTPHGQTYVDPRDGLNRCRRRLRALLDVIRLQPAERIAGKRAAAVGSAVADQIGGFDFATFSIPHLIPDALVWANYPGWTVGLLRHVVAAMATTAGRDPDDLLAATLATARRNLAGWKVHVRHLDARAGDLRRERLLPDPAQLDRVIRYEHHLNRQLTQTLAHLRQLQHSRPTHSPQP